MAVMSARNDTATSADGIYRFNMELPIPAYLLALAVGNIAFQSLGPRTGIYAEPAMLDRAAWEFADTESMLQAAERLLGPYRWGRYDLLVLPPSFPFGGMENPRLTFATPTVIAGDRSLVALVAHELAHSWSGNLTTAATWNDIWLNEGFTTYFERRIVEEVYGREYADMEAVIARQILDDDLREMGPDSADTQLYLQLEGRSPDDASDFIYEKGYFFLRLLEESFGREEWDRFLLGYFDRFAFRTITTREFTTYLRDRLTHHDRKLEESLRIEEWIYGRGVPSNCPTVRSEAFVRVDREIAAWRDGKPARKLKTSQWTSQQWIHFLKGLPGELPLNRMEELDKAFLFSRSGNSEIMFEWLARVVETEYHEGYPALERFLTSVGRRKFVKPLFGKLVETRDGRLLAQRIYAKARPCYHPLTVRSIDAIIGAHPDSSDN
jgi:aminopeptidase N